MANQQINELILNAISKTSQTDLSNIETTALLDALLDYYKPKYKDKLSKLVSSVLKNELTDRINNLIKTCNETTHEVKAAESLFKLMEDLLGLTFNEVETDSEIERLATNVTFQFKNLIIYREFVKAILRHITFDEDLGVISISILKDSADNIEQADYNFIKEIIKQIEKLNIDTKATNASFDADNKEVC